MTNTPIRALISFAAFASLAACGDTGEDAEIDMAPATPAQIEVESDALPPADGETFTAVFAETCPDAKPVTAADCRAAGMGSSDFLCEYSLREDEYKGSEAVLTAGEDAYTITDPETICAQGA